MSDIPLSALSDDISSSKDNENCRSISPHLQLFPFPSSTGRGSDELIAGRVELLLISVGLE